MSGSLYLLRWWLRRRFGHSSSIPRKSQDSQYYQHQHQQRIWISSHNMYSTAKTFPPRLQDSTLCNFAYPAPSAPSLSQGRSHRLPCLRTPCCTGRPTWSGAAGASLDTRGGGLATSTHRGISKRQWLAYSEDTWKKHESCWGWFIDLVGVLCGNCNCLLITLEKWFLYKDF